MMHLNLYQNFTANLKLKNLCRVQALENQSIKQNRSLDFSSNDYLQLSQSKELLKSGITAAKILGLGSTGSRLLSGNSNIFGDFETEIALAKKSEKALLFNSGFQANLTVLSALLNKRNLKKEPLVFFDKYNHKSLYEGVALSQAKLIRYAHLDMDHLAHLLKKNEALNHPKFIVTETVYGMDGDVLHHEKITKLARQYGALLYLDEAHATGTVGQKGYGLSTEMDLQGVQSVVMGTFSKALGGAGAYVACSEAIYQYLVNCCSGFIYSTSASPMMIGAMQKAWSLLPEYQEKVLAMLTLADFLRGKLKQLGYHTGESSTHIIPLICQSASQALELKQELNKNQILVSFVQYPSVPKDQPRLRIALNINHTKQDIDKLLSHL